MSDELVHPWRGDGERWSDITSSRTITTADLDRAIERIRNGVEYTPDYWVTDYATAQAMAEWQIRHDAWEAGLPTLDEVCSWARRGLRRPRWLWKLLTALDYRWSARGDRWLRQSRARWRDCPACGRGFGWRSEWDIQRQYRVGNRAAHVYCPGHVDPR